MHETSADVPQAACRIECTDFRIAQEMRAEKGVTAESALLLLRGGPPTPVARHCPKQRFGVHRFDEMLAETRCS